MRLRDVELGDVDAYVRMRCDPAMTAGLGGPLPREGIEAKVAQDVREAAADTEDGEPISEIGWMVLPEFQGRGIGTMAVRALLQLARDAGRWGLVHAFPATTNGPSNGICRSAGFRFAGELDVTFAGRVIRTSHWVINPRVDLT